MRKSPHTTKAGPGRRHVEETYRNGKGYWAKRNLFGIFFGDSGDKLARKVVMKQLTKRA